MSELLINLGVQLNDIKNKIFQRTFEWVEMKWSKIIRADIMISASGPSAQIMTDQITSDKVIR